MSKYVTMEDLASVTEFGTMVGLYFNERNLNTEEDPFLTFRITSDYGVEFLKPEYARLPISCIKPGKLASGEPTIRIYVDPDEDPLDEEELPCNVCADERLDISRLIRDAI
ncbi:MAG: hypothetical protein LUC83_09315 [Clostridiales bacterium]|nr:hypothetical protein [Clostridiales bacterium]